MAEVLSPQGPPTASPSFPLASQAAASCVLTCPPPPVLGHWPEGHFSDRPILHLQVPPEATFVLSFEVILHLTLHPTPDLLPPHWEGSRPLRLDPPPPYPPVPGAI